MMTDKELLIKAKEYLWNGEGSAPNRSNSKLTQYICLSIDEATGQYIRNEQSSKLAWIIEDLLGGKISVNNYLYELTGKEQSNKNTQEFRHRWLDHLINCCNKKGKLTYKLAGGK